MRLRDGTQSSDLSTEELERRLQEAALEEARCTDARGSRRGKLRNERRALTRLVRARHRNKQ